MIRLIDKAVRRSRVAIVLSCLLVAGSTALWNGSSIAAERTLVITEDADYFGRDYEILKDVELDACKKSCLGNKLCTAFTYNGSAKWCFLKSEFGDLRGFVGAVSGRIVEEDLPKPSVVKERIAELAFLRKGMIDEAKKFATGLGKVYDATGKTYGELVDEAEPYRLGGFNNRASDLYGKALSISGDSYLIWQRYAQSLFGYEPTDWRLKRRVEEYGSAAAINAYLRADTVERRASALAVLGQTLEKRRMWRLAIRSYRASLAVRDDKNVRVAYDSVVAKHGFRVADHTVDADAAAPRICLVFSYPLPSNREGLTDYLAVRGGEGLAKEAEERQICVDGIEHGKRYQLTLRPGLPSADGEKIERAVNLDLYVRDRAPSVRFTGRSYVLPKGGNAAVPVVSINTETIEARIHRIGDRSLARAVTEGTFLRQLNSYQIEEIGDRTGEMVWSGEIGVGKELNKEVTTAIPVGEVIDTLKSGAYVMTARARGDTSEDWGPRASQWFVVSDLGLTTLKGNDGLTAIVRSLSGAEPLAGTTLRLVAANDEVLGTVQTDENGVANFQPGLLRGKGGSKAALLVAQGTDGDYGFLDLTKAAFDLSDRGVEGRQAPPPLDVYLVTERGIYRPGETVHATALLRDARANAVSGLPLTMIFSRPDGVEHSRTTAADQGLGGHAIDLELSGSAMRGTWRLAVHADPKGAALSETSFLVEDFQPERIDYELTSAAKALDPRDVAAVELEARYLYGAIAADLVVEGDLAISSTREMAAWTGYKFGLADETIETVRNPIAEGVKTDAEGRAVIPIALEDLPSTTRLFTASVVTRVVDAGGRRVERKLDLPVIAEGTRIGIKPLFEDAVEEGGTAAFNVILVAPDGSRVAAENMTWTLLDLDTSYQWYRENGRWNYEPVTVSKRVASGTLSVGTEDEPGKIEMPVKWGRYRLEVAIAGAQPQPVATSVGFDAGWYIAQSAAETPDFLRVALDKSAYRVGETVRVHIKPRFAGKAVVMVVDDRLIDMKAIDVGDEGTTTEFTVTSQWGAGAYVTATLLRPMDLAAKRMPARALGLAHAGVDVAARDLALSLDVPDTIRPRQSLDIGLSIDGLPAGAEAYVTVAAVDVGILNLTGYKPPAPDDHYFGRRRLGMEIRDLYGQLIDRMQGVAGQIRSGGDGGGMSLKAPPPTEKLVAFFSGIVLVDETGKAMVSFDVPDFNGSIRLMAQAWTADGVGHATTDVISRDPIVIAASVPQFMAPGDRSRLLVELTHTEGPSGPISYSVRTDDKLTLTAGTADGELELGDNERKQIAVPIQAEVVGDAGLDIVIETPSGVQLTKSLTVPVRANEPPVSRRNVIALGAETGKLTVGNEILSEFLPGTGSVAVSISGAGGLDIPAIVSALDKYPYGCAEQITSRALPLVYLDSVSVAAGLGREAEVAPRVQQAIAGVLAKQSASGAFGLWRPGHESMWLDSYVTDFLVRAKENGYSVPAISYDLAIDNLSNRLAYASDFDKGGEDIAYGLYVLARSGRASIGDLRYYADAKINAFSTPLAKAQIGAALALYGDRLRADKAFKAAYAALSRGQDNPRWSRDDYGSNLRDGAALLTLVAESKSKAIDMKRLAAGLAKRRQTLRHTSTQENAWLLLAANALVGSVSRPDLRIDGRRLTGAMYSRFSAEQLLGEPIEVVNAGKSPLDAVITATGVPRIPEPAGGNGYQIERTYYNLKGELIDIAEIAQNERFVAVLTVTAENDVQGRLLVVDPLPAGIEIDNPNLLQSGNIAALDWLGLHGNASHTEFRADRFVASIHRSSRSPLSFRLGYIARAVSPGSFAHPAAIVEDMYRPEQRARTASGRVDVIGPIR